MGVGITLIIAVVLLTMCVLVGMMISKLEEMAASMYSTAKELNILVHDLRRTAVVLKRMQVEKQGKESA